MTSSEVFPAWTNTEPDPIVAIARRCECDVDAVDAAFRGLEFLHWATKEHLDTLKATTHALNEAERHASNLRSALRRLSPAQVSSLIDSGAPTIPQIEFLAAVLRGDAENLDSYRRLHDRTGGRNPAAHMIAKGIRRLFWRLEKKSPSVKQMGTHPPSLEEQLSSLSELLASVATGSDRLKMLSRSNSR